jgi:restriction system protein
MAVSLLPALGVAVLVGGGATAWLWGVQRSRIERTQGLTLLSAMRWREFSRIVVEGLRSRGFVPEGVEETAERGQDSVIHLRREGREWLLACKQGINYRITPVVIGDITDAVRFHGADGGVVATPGEAEGPARRLADGRVELIDGEQLWPLVHPQLAPGVREELAANARKAVTRQSALAWVGAVVLGIAVGTLFPSSPEAPAAPVATTRPATVAPTATTPATAPGAAAPDAQGESPSEDVSRKQVASMVATLPGIGGAVWTTRSTLMVNLADENADPVAGICEVLDKYEELRTSRLHLQPPTGSAKPARFLQCRTY